eukprot:scaffold56151_cov45-Phaeocystis_antarctica.AAC.1
MSPGTHSGHVRRSRDDGPIISNRDIAGIDLRSETLANLRARTTLSGIAGRKRRGRGGGERLGASGGSETRPLEAPVARPQPGTTLSLRGGIFQITGSTSGDWGQIRAT